MEFALGVEAVEDNTIDRNGDHLNHHLNDATHERPVHQATDQIVVDIIFENVFPGVALATPAPYVLTIGRVS